MTPPPLTSEQLDQMDWAQFERCVVDLIRKTYGEVVEIRQTGHTDGGRDGEGRFTLQAGQLSLNIDVWVEVKQRSRGPLGAKDFGATTFRAVIEPVNKLILATNRTLSAPYRDQLSIFGQRLRIDVTVLEQADIISLSRGADGGSSEPAQGRIRLAPTSPLAVSARLISDPFGPIQKSEIEPDSLAYIMVDVRCDVAGGLCRYDLDVAFTTPPDLGNTPRHVEGVLVGPGFRRHLFAFLPPSGARFSLEEIAKLTASVITEEGAAPLQIVATPSTMSVSRRPLRATSLPYQDKLIDSIVRDMADNARPPFFLIQASAGAGKSYIVQKLRTMCACQEREVLWLDGEETNTPAGLFRAIVKTCFANTQALIDPECKERFQGWLAENGFSPHQAEALASAALDSWQDFVIPPDVCLDTAALLISKVASLRPFALFFEDLHKVSTTTIDMLRGLLPRVAGVERGVVVVLTSRPTDIRYGDEGKAKIASELLAPLEGVKALQWLRMEPTEAEKVEGARLLLRSALPGLPEWRLSMVDRSMSLAASILEQVGTTPFNIKEALLFLEHEKLVSPRGDGTYDVCDHTALRRRVRAGKLEGLTEKRLHGFISQHPAQAFAFLIAGALLGRVFSKSLGVRASGGRTGEFLSGVLDQLIYWDIIRLGGEPDKLRFSHDLIRQSLINIAANRAETAREVAQALYDALGDGLADADADQKLQLARIASVARIGMKAAGHLDDAAGAFAEQRRHLDAAFTRLTLVELCSPDYADICHLAGKLPDFLARDPVLQAFPPANGPRLELADYFEQLMSAAESFLAGGLGETAGLGPLVGQIQMAAKRLGKSAEARAEYLLGRLHFARDEFAEAATHHLRALVHIGVDPLASSNLPDGNLKQVEENVDRLLLCARQLGQAKQVRILLRYLNAVLEKRGGSLLKRRTRLANRIGYAHLYHCPAATTRLWRKQLRYAVQECSTCPPTDLADAEERMASALIGTAIMEFSTGLTELGIVPRHRLLQAEGILERIQRRNLLIRVHLSLAGIDMVEGRLLEARSHAAEAELLATSFGNVRRIWRVLAMRACIEECLNAASPARDQTSAPPAFLDEQVLMLIGSRIRAEEDCLKDGNAPWMSQRHALAAINAIVRTPALAEKLPRKASDHFLRIADSVRSGDLSKVPLHLRVFFKPIPEIGIRAIVTE